MKIRVIPVLDLKDGFAVHAVRGERSRYEPVRSVLSPSAEPVAVAQAYHSRLGLGECYVADLDAIARRGDHGPVVRAMAKSGLAVWLDAGVATASDARRAAALGAARIIVGTETLGHVDDLPAIVDAVADTAPGGVALSLDLRAGKLLGGSAAVEALDPVELAATAWRLGVRTFIVLDLSRVGAAGGVETGPALRMRQALPAAEIAIGGGVRDAADLRALAQQGFDAALIATALHSGVITAATLAALA
jgi:phosphoribosylformimino-5-aminoimidazole carboxamide ribotide isomerase